MKHIPVLVREVLEYLDPKPNQDFIDCTLGLGGHAEKILSKTSPKGKLLAIEQNLKGLNEAKKNLQKFEDRIIFANDNFTNLNTIAKSEGFKQVSGIFLDLGLASWQIEEGGLGITFSKNEPLDMRLAEISNFSIRAVGSTSQRGQFPISNKISKSKYKNITAADIVNKYSVKELANIFYKFGDMRNSWSVARKIDLSRRQSSIKTTFDLIQAVKTKNPKILAPLFQALRIVVNNELENLERTLPHTIDLLKPDGRLVVIAYHSGEDRIVKNFLRSNKDCFKILTKKPIIASLEETKNNPRSRSAKLRAGEKL